MLRPLCGSCRMLFNKGVKSLVSQHSDNPQDKESTCTAVSYSQIRKDCNCKTDRGLHPACFTALSLFYMQPFASFTIPCLFYHPVSLSSLAFFASFTILCLSTTFLYLATPKSPYRRCALAVALIIFYYKWLYLGIIAFKHLA